MVNPYGVQGTPRVGKALGGWPKRKERYFNEALATQAFAVAATVQNTVYQFPITISYTSVCELDITFKGSTAIAGQPQSEFTIIPMPTGITELRLFASSQEYLISFNSTTGVVSFTPIGTSGYNGSLIVTRRYRKIRNYTYLATAQQPAGINSLPNPIRTFEKTWIGADIPAGVFNRFGTWARAALGLSASTWHIVDSNGTFNGFRLISNLQFQVNSSGPAGTGTYIIEFE